MKKIFKTHTAFTLAETLIVLVILGVVASITIPALVNRHRENANRTKIKKAMTVYDTALNKMVIENNLKSDNDIDNFVGENCANTRPYFKSAKDGANNCSFRTSDGLWWNISDIKNPVISLKDEVPTVTEDVLATAKDTSDNKIYAMKGWFDTNGSLRIDDLGKVSDSDKAYLTKLYNFANNVKSPKIEVSERVRSGCLNNQACMEHFAPYDNIVCSEAEVWGVNCYENMGGFLEYYDENGNYIGGMTDADTSAVYGWGYDSVGYSIYTNESLENGRTRNINYNCYGESSCYYTIFVYDSEGNSIQGGDNCESKEIESCKGW